MRQYLFLTLFFLSSFTHLYCENLPVPQSSEEALFARRIIEFWRDEEYPLVRKQIQEFLSIYPSSSFSESFYVIMGDISFKEKNIERALEWYEKIHSSSFILKTQENKANCLYRLKKYSLLENFLEPLVKNTASLPQHLATLFPFYYAESLFRQALLENDLLEKKDLCEKALPYYKYVLDSDFDTPVRFALADLYHIIGEYPEAATLYLSLAEETPDKYESLLFAAARIIAYYDKGLSRDTLMRLIEKKGEKAHEAAYSWLVLSFEGEYYSDIIAHKISLESSTAAPQTPFLFFALGKSFFVEEDYISALLYFEKYLSSTPSPSSRMRNALFMTIEASRNISEIPSLSYAVDLFEKSFPQDPKLPEVLFSYAITLKDKDPCRTQATLSRILRKYPSFPHRDGVTYELALILYSQGLWEESHTILTTLISSYPESSYVQAALQNLVNVSLRLVETHEEHLSEGLQHQLVLDIRRALDSSHPLEHNIKESYKLHLAHALYNTKKYDDVIEVLSSFVQDFPASPSLSQAHYLLTLCYHTLHDNEFTFIHGERTLALNGAIEEKAALHRILFSSSLALAQRNVEEETQTMYFDKAAYYLYLIFDDGSHSIKNDNKLWLVSHYFTPLQEYMKSSWHHNLEESGYLTEAHKAKKLFQNILSLDEETRLSPIDEDTLALETTLYKYTLLLGWLNIPEEKESLLTQICEYYSKEPSWAWKMKDQVYMSLGELYEETGKTSQALATFLPLLSNDALDAPTRHYAQLHHARLVLQSHDLSVLDDADVEEALKTLKNLQIRKKLANEPIYLEAALAYAEAMALRPSTSSGHKTYHESLRFYLSRMKEDFSIHKDIWSKDYEASRALLPEKDFIYQAYIMLIDARIAALESSIAYNKEETFEGYIKEEAAKAIFSSLVTGKLAVTRFLVEKASTDLKKLHSNIATRQGS
jgi:tetratricopeptide (TPR) repeat protein